MFKVGVKPSAGPKQDSVRGKSGIPGAGAVRLVSGSGSASGVVITWQVWGDLWLGCVGLSKFSALARVLTLK